MTRYTLRIQILDYWHPGGGRGGGAVVDAVAHRDSDGLPVLPGRHLKGLLRDAMERAEAFGWHDSGLTEVLFGGPSRTAGPAPRAGCLRVGNGALPADVSRWLARHQDGRAALPRLYRTLYATAVDHESGTARDKSLRGIEVVVPLDLEARVEAIPHCPAPPGGWWEALAQAVTLIDAVGAYRSRGLGRARITLEETP